MNRYPVLDFGWEKDEHETRKAKRERKKREKKNKVIQEVIDLLRTQEGVVGSCHGCPNVYKDAANFLVRNYGVGKTESDGIEHDHVATTTVTLMVAVRETPQFMSIISPDTNKSQTVRIVGVSDDRKKLQVIRP